VLLNTSLRLGLWCAAMRDLCARIEHDPRGQCPTNLVEKAYRWADRVADKLGASRVARSGPAASIGDAIRDLDGLSRWCTGLTTIAPAA